MKRKTSEIRAFILEMAYQCHPDLARLVEERFGISRQAASQNIRALIKDKLVIAKGSRRNRVHRLKLLLASHVSIEITDKTEENQIWSQTVAPHFKDIKANVREICHHGFTEMMNNVIDHSSSNKADITIWRTAITISIRVRDYGVGIWRKLQGRFNLADARHAILELAKGKLTTDPEKHTGEGIFFTSRMFDDFILQSDDLSYCCFQTSGEYLFDVKEETRIDGTLVDMEIHLNSEKTASEVFNKFTSEFDDFGFTRTQLSIELAKYEGDHLISRSQAKRILARLHEFKEVCLDFRGISHIGQAFADEIFRIFRKQHPEVKLFSNNTNPEVDKMIKRVTLGIEGEEQQPELPLNN